jgi:hypothetical protein
LKRRRSAILAWLAKQRCKTQAQNARRGNEEDWLFDK